MSKRFLLLFTFFMLLVPISADAKKIDMGQFKLTAYCPCYECSEGYGRKTSSGAYCESGHTIAVDHSKIDPGSKVLIGDTVYIAEDTGGGVEGDHIDIFFDTHEEVEEFGVKWRHIWVIK